MFMTPREIASQFSPHDADREDTMRGEEDDFQVWRRKAKEAVTGDYMESSNMDPVPLAPQLEAEGMKNPINLMHGERSLQTGRPMLGDGHHRLGYSLYTKPDSLVPVEHYEDEESMMDHNYKRWQAEHGR